MRSPAVQRTSETIAKYSYGIYLTHGLAMWIAFVRLAAYPLAVRWAVFVPLAVAAPVVAYHGLEEPLIRLGRKLAARPPRFAREPARDLRSGGAMERANGLAP
jgi:peptidoglycan/LPS O-acetylase OafA/YrhL